MTWFFITILAISFQIERNLLQKHLRGKLGTIEVSWARIFFVLPFLLIALGYLLVARPDLLLNIDSNFYLCCFGAAIAQILATLCLVELFSRRNFTIGIAYSKTDVIQVTILAAIFLSQSIPPLAIFAVLISFVAIILLSPAHNNLKLIQRIFHISAGLGVLVGFFLSVTTIFMKKAMIEVERLDDSKILPVAVVFVIYVIMQNFAYIIYELYRKRLRATFSTMVVQWRQCSLIGIFSMLGTICWLAAFSIQLVSYVKLVAQLEILLSLFISYRFLKEKNSATEIAGMVLLIASVITILFV